MEPLHWYALKVFYNRYAPLASTFARDGMQSYVPPHANMLMFVRCTEQYIARLDALLVEKAMVYHLPGTTVPAFIPDAEMERFMQLSARNPELFDVMPYRPAVAASPRYRVVGGACPGMEGHYCRINNERRLVIPLGKLLMLVSSYHIPRRYLEAL